MKSNKSDAWKDLVRRFQMEMPEEVDDLEETVEALLDSSWDEDLRLRAHEVSVALTDRSRLYGFDEVSSLARAVSSLVRLPLEEVISLQDALRDKLGELLGLLKAAALESASRRIA